MKDKKGKFTSYIIVLATLILAVVAIFVGLKLYKLRQESVSPTAPESESEAAKKTACEALTFKLATPTPTVTPTPTPTPTKKPTATPRTTRAPTQPPSPKPKACNQSCEEDTDCASGLICQEGSCRNNLCVEKTDCKCDIGGPEPTETPEPAETPIVIYETSSPTEAPELPPAGFSLPTIIGAGAGAALLILSLLLAL